MRVSIHTERAAGSSACTDCAETCYANINDKDMITEQVSVDTYEVCTVFCLVLVNAIVGNITFIVLLLLLSS